MVAAAAAGGGKTLLKYERSFLIECGRHVNASMLQPNWAKLCSQFKDVCLSPQVSALLILSAKVNVVNTGGDQLIAFSVCVCASVSVHMMTHVTS